MALEFVVGLFATRGIAEDAVNRLKYEGVEAQEITLLLLRETAPLGATQEVPSLDPTVVSDARDTYAEYISNGETLLFVRTATAEDVELAAWTIRQYAPLGIRLVTVSEGAPIGRELPLA